MSVSRKPPVAPTGATGLTKWAQDVYRYLQDLTAAMEQPRPQVLPRLKPTDRATTDGIIMWDAVNERPVISQGGVWRAFTLEP